MALGGICRDGLTWVVYSLGVQVWEVQYLHPYGESIERHKPGEGG